MIAFLFRGILRDKSRFLFPFSIVTIGVALVVALVGFMEGVFMGMIDMTANLDAGHLRLVNKPFYDEEHLRPLDRSLAAQEETREWLIKHSPEKVKWFPRIRWGAILDVPDKNGDTLSQTPIVGMALELRNKNSLEIDRLRLKESLIGGKIPELANEMLMGNQLAETLGVELGQTVTLMGQSFDGGLVTDNYRVVGLVKFGVSAMDKKMALIDILDAQNSFYMEDMITDWLGFLPPQFSLDEYEKIKGDMQEPLSRWRESSPKSWAKDDYPILLSIRDQQNLGAIADKFKVIKGFVVGIFTFLMILVLWNAGIISGIHRYGEMGLRLAFGESHWNLIFTLGVEGLLIGILGTLAGCLFGGTFAWFLQEVGINMGDSFAQPGLLTNDVMRARLTIGGFIQGIIPGLYASVAG
ncbi:MAG: ABC transporter permease, partial [Nitrospinae bacterium]|nr:ABC transporter permease [Nitrospinota bacterium]